MSLEYFTDDEYQRVFFEFGDFRAKIVERLRTLTNLEEGIILDLLSGHSLLSAEVAKKFPNSIIIGTGLLNDIESYQRVKSSNQFQDGVWSKVQYIGCDVSTIPLKSESCDLIVNFLGLEDVNMTRGTSGIESVFQEVRRLLIPEGLLQISLVEYGESPAEALAKEIWETIGLNAVYLKRDEYLQILEPIGFEVVDEFVLNLGKKMTSEQAREELEFACNEAPRIFSGFRVSAIGIDELWNIFSERIEEFGVAYLSPVRILVLMKKGYSIYSIG